MSPRIRKKMDLDVEGKIIVIDEGHNIENVAEEVLSLDFKLEHLLEIKRILFEIRNRTRTFNTNRLLNLIISMENL